MEPSEQDTDPQVATDPTVTPEVAPPAPELTLADTEPGTPVAPDLDAVTPEVASTSGAATNLDLPSLELPHPAYPQHQQVSQQMSQPPAYQTPAQAYGQTPYAVPAPPAQPYSQTPYAVPEPPAQPYGQQYSQPGYTPQPGYLPQSGYGQLVPSTQLSPTDEATWATAAHWSSLLGGLISLPFLGPLLVLLIQGPKSARVRANAVESLNFDITMIIAFVVSLLLTLVVIGVVLVPLVGIAWLVFKIIAAVQTSSGQDYRYPVSIRLVK